MKSHFERHRVYQWATCASCAVIMTPRRNIASSIRPTRYRETRTFVRLNIGVGAKRNSFENAKRTRNKRDFFTKKNCRKNPVYTLRKERRDAHHSFSLPVPVLKWTFWFQNESSRVQYSFVFADHFECAKLCGRQTKLKFEVSFIYTIFT